MASSWSCARCCASQGAWSSRGLTHLARSAQATPLTTSGSPLIVTPGPLQWSTAEVLVDGDDVSNVALSPQPAVAIAGRLAFEGTRRPPEPGKIGLSLPFAGQTIGSYQASLPQIQLEPGGRFLISGILPGAYRLGALQSQPVKGIRAPIGAWWLKSIVIPLTSAGVEKKTIELTAR